MISRSAATIPCEPFIGSLALTLVVSLGTSGSPMPIFTICGVSLAYPCCTWVGVLVRSISAKR